MSVTPTIIDAIPCHGMHSLEPLLLREEHKKYERLPNGQVKITTTVTQHLEGLDKPNVHYKVDFI